MGEGLEPARVEVSVVVFLRLLAVADAELAEGWGFEGEAVLRGCEPEEVDGAGVDGGGTGDGEDGVEGSLSVGEGGLLEDAVEGRIAGDGVGSWLGMSAQGYEEEERDQKEAERGTSG